MKLYMHPVSMVSRPVRLFIADQNVPVTEEVVVDLMTGEHYGEAFTKINPSRQVPVLEDGAFRMTESSAILKYLADRCNLEAVYPKDLQQRARVNEVMDWVNTGFYRDYGYGLTYPQVFPNHKRRSEEAHAATIAWGAEKSRHWLQVLNDHYIGTSNYVAGPTMTIADYFAIGPVTAGELVGCDFAAYPNVARWVATMKKLPSWGKINEVFDGFAASVKGQKFVSV
jgi:glutathione S-transferase